MNFPFPEIEEFFKQAEFSEEDLACLKNKVEAKYKDIQVKKAAFSLINLHLAKFKIGIDAISEHEEIIRAKESNEFKQQTAKGVSEEKWRKLKHKTINQIAKLHHITKNELKTAFRIFEIKLLSEKRISRKDYVKLRDYKKKIIEQKRQNSSIRKKRKNIKLGIKPKSYRKAGTGVIPSKRIGIKKGSGSSNQNSGVYDKIERSGGTGKIIYTRM
jgi:hypothetical protein